MRRALFAVSGTVVGLVLLLSFKTHPTAVSTPPAALGTPTPGHTGGASPAPGSTSGAGGSSGSKTVTGQAAQTPYGPVQVQITVARGTVTNVTAVDYPQNTSRDAQINSFAIPQLNQEATAARSTNIDMVSGATYTSQGYLQSLQSALDQAGL
jgi:FMN-binding domain